MYHLWAITHQVLLFRPGCGPGTFLRQSKRNSVTYTVPKWIGYVRIVLGSAWYGYRDLFSPEPPRQVHIEGSVVVVPVLKGGRYSTLSPAGTRTTRTLVPRYEVVFL